MHLSIRLNLNNLVGFEPSSAFSLAFENITNLQEWYDEEENVTSLDFQIEANTRHLLYVFTNGSTLPSYDFEDDDIYHASSNSNYIDFECDINDNKIEEVLTLIQNGAIVLSSEKTIIYAYRLNSERDYIEKDLIPITILEGNFKAPLGIKNIDLDVINYRINNSYNYVFIPSLNRYYYVSNILLVTKDYTRLQLQEDVLMSHKVLIKGQKAFVSRYENSTESDLIDARRPVKDILKVENITPLIVDTPSAQSLKNTYFDFNNNNSKDYPNILVTTLSTYVASPRTGYLHAPSGSGLPDISSQLNDFEWVSFIRPSKLFYLAKAYLSSSAKASYIASAIWLPFNPITSFALATSPNYAIFVEDKYIDANGEYVQYNLSGTPLETFNSTSASGIDGVCPYLIIKDFTYYNYDGFEAREPNSNYEFFIPFVGWVVIPSSKFFNKRILVYYTMDLKTGLSTAYIYNYTDKIVVWSGTCQIGIKIDLSTTNIEENIRQKQANNLNMILGLFSSAISVGVGIASENPVAIVGGILGGAKTVTGFVNTNNQIFDRAQMSFGTSNGALYSNNDLILLKTYHETITIDLPTYKHLEGLPYNKYVEDLTALNGYVEIGDIHFDPKGENIYNAEIDEIVGLLKGGVIF